MAWWYVMTWCNVVTGWHGMTWWHVMTWWQKGYLWSRIIVEILVWTSSLWYLNLAFLACYFRGGLLCPKHTYSWGNKAILPSGRGGATRFWHGVFIKKHILLSPGDFQKIHVSLRKNINFKKHDIKLMQTTLKKHQKQMNKFENPSHITNAELWVLLED